MNDPIAPTEQHIAVHLPFGQIIIGERVPGLPKSRAQCYKCQQVLEFIQGPSQIQCGKCQSVN